jgi:aspartate beta-hydroxylase
LRTSLHRPQPSLLFLPGLRSLPFWTQWDGKSNRVAYQDPLISKVVAHLESHVDSIRSEYHRVATGRKSDYQTDTEHTLHKGIWDWHSYMTKGNISDSFLRHFPDTSKVLQELRDEGHLFEGTPFGYSFFSTLHGKSRIDPHTAPMNLRVRIHLPLIVPTSTTSTTTDDGETKEVECGIRVGPVTKRWTEGKAMVLDDSFQHEVWNDTDEQRVVLLVDIWHPDVTQQERKDIVETFEHAQQQGWWSNSSE